MRSKCVMSVAMVFMGAVTLLASLQVAAAEQPSAPAPAGPQGMTGQQAGAILDELRQIRRILERAQQSTEPRQAARPVVGENTHLSIGNAVVMGLADAPVTLVEFTDLQCPYCRQFHTTAFQQIKKDWIDTGKLRFVSRDFPLDMHDHAMAAALAVRCAGEQQRFWEMRHTLTVNSTNLSPSDVSGFARAAGLNMEQFTTCLESGRFKAEVQADIDAGRAVGVSGTPSFVIGRTNPGGVEGVMIVGAQSYATFNAKIREMLGE